MDLPLTPPTNEPISTFVFFILAFLAIGVIFLFMHLVMGSFIRPCIPETEKLTIYECGEPTVGSAWVQFDVRYYVVALLFVVFDVEVAFFFPWATVFGNANQLANANLKDERRLEISQKLLPIGVATKMKQTMGLTNDAKEVKPITAAAASGWAKVAFWDILVFFGVLMVGFAYLWRRGDLNWIRTVTHRGGTETAEPAAPAPDVKAVA